MRHEYNNERYKSSSLRNYHLSKAMSKCNTLYNNILYSNIKSEGISTIDKSISNKVGNILINISDNKLINEQNNVLDELIHIYKESKIKKYIKIAKYTSQNKEMILAKTPREIYSHEILTLAWDKLIEVFHVNGN